MARPRSISTDLILEAAKAVFLERGMAATTAEIARSAGISEGTIFKRFGTKDALFLAAMGIDARPPWTETLLERCGTSELPVLLREIAASVLEFFVELIPKAAMLMSCRISPEEIFAAQEDPPPLRALRLMAAFFDREQELGRIREEADPNVLCRMFLGSLHSFAWNEHAGLNRRMPIASADYIEGLVTTLLAGAGSGER